MTDANDARWQEEQEFYRGLIDANVLTHDEASELRSKIPLALVRKLMGRTPLLVAPELDFLAPGEAPPTRPVEPWIDFSSPDGSVWRLTFNDQGTAQTNRVEN